jgi:hypothetical protein
VSDRDDPTPDAETIAEAINEVASTISAALDPTGGSDGIGIEIWRIAEALERIATALEKKP